MNTLASKSTKKGRTMNGDNDNNNSGQDRALLQKSKLALNRTVEAGVTLSAPQRKALNAVHYALQCYVMQNFESVDLFHSKYANKILDFKMKRQQFLTLISYSSRNQVFLRNILKQLSKIQIDWHNGESGSKESYMFSNIFMEAGLANGYVHVKIPSHTRRALVDANVEATIDIARQSNSLFGKYAISLFEVVQSRYEKCEEHTFSFEIEDGELRNALNVSYVWKGGKRVYSYPMLGKLNEKVLKPAISEINDADLEFKIEHSHTKLGCGTVVWRFQIARSSYTKHRIIASEFAPEMASLSRAFSRFGIKRPLEVLTKISSEKDVLYHQFCVENVEKAMRSRKPGTTIKNPAGYFLKTLEQNKEAFEEHYQDILAKRNIEKRRARNAELQRIDEQIEASAKEQRKRMRNAQWDALPTEQQRILHSEFLESVRMNPALGSKFVKIIENDGIDSLPRIRGAWASFVDEYFGITEESISASLENMVVEVTYR